MYQRQGAHCACDPQDNRRPHRQRRPSTEHTLPWFAFTHVDACNSEPFSQNSRCFLLMLSKLAVFYNSSLVAGLGGFNKFNRNQ